MRQKTLALAAALSALAALPVTAAQPDSDTELSSDMRQELEKSDRANVENSLARANTEAGRAHESLRELLSAAGRDLKAEQTHLDSLLQEEERLRRPATKPSEPGWVEKIKESRETLALANDLLLQKAETYAQKASSASSALAAAEKRIGKTTVLYNSKDREADLQVVKKELAFAQGRWGAKALRPAQQQALAALADCLFEMRGALEQSEKACAVLSPGREKPLAEIAARLRGRIKSVAREAEILKVDLLLARYDEDPHPAR